MEYLLLQMLNGVQLGLLMFLLAAGLTLTFGIMDLVNLAHGSLYMMGAYFAATFVAWTGSFVLGVLLALGATLLLGIVLEFVALRHLYGRDHLDHGHCPEGQGAGRTASNGEVAGGEAAGGEAARTPGRREPHEGEGYGID